ncbi:hypothetical protein K435DRAFT_386447 [Dendrothele bispora CBS 962.96]|uniref:mitogen-activated protein kinase kinase kinase n=1 Tax=Dendrothele bispora (strain CBS 962.96) TaxID=1314807 RepID=A0A4S8L9Z6_DENBC|nr:hypothetical protein K435DRAFT_386447 [Dendrothele bispora CBS 962.96]
MTTVVEKAQPRRVIQPKYEFDPDAIYPDPEVQKWATYYAQGGLDPGGAKHFTSVPGLENKNGEPSSRPSLTINTDSLERPKKRPAKTLRVEPEDFDYLRDTYGVSVAHPTNTTVLYDFKPSRPDELAINYGEKVCELHRFDDGWCLVKDVEGKRGMVPGECLNGVTPILKLPGPRTLSSLSRLTPVRSPVTDDEPSDLSRRKSKRTVLGLLEFMSITKKSKQKEMEDTTSTTPDPPPFAQSKSKPALRSVLKKRLSGSGSNYTDTDATESVSQSQSSRRVRFDSAENLEFQFSTYTKSTATSTNHSNPDEEDDISDAASTDTDDYQPFLDSPSLLSPGLPPSYEELDGTLSNLANTSFSTEKISASPPPFVIEYADPDSKSTFQSGETVDLDTSAPHTLVKSAVPEVVVTTATSTTSSLSSAQNILSLQIIYRNLLSLLVEEVSSEDTLRATLHEYLVSLQSLEPVSSLVQSRSFRANLLQVALALDISEDHRVREALQKDEYHIASVLHNLSQSDVSKRAVLALEGDDAQNFLDVVQDVLDKAYLLSQEENARARRLLVRLSETCDKLPSSLFIKGVEKPDEQAAFGGGFGDVYRATYGAKHVALKRMRIFQRDPGLPNIRRRFCREALVWQHLNSTFIVPFLGIDAESFPSFLCMVSPWMRHGTVLKHLADHGRAGVDKRLHEVAQGLAYLHSQNIVHGDLRGANILINDDWQACLTDFGLTVFNDATAVTFTSRREGSVRWMAPELHVPETFGLDRFRLTSETDIYAFGCVCLEVSVVINLH